MCEPATILTAVALGTEVVGAIEKHKAQAQAAKANKQAANTALRLGNRDIDARKFEETQAEKFTVDQAAQQTRQSTATAEASAAEAGVSGASVDLLLGDIQRQAGTYRQAAETNLDSTLSQLERERAGLSADAQSRINAVAPPSYIQTGLEIASAGINAANQLRLRRPNVAK